MANPPAEPTVILINRALPYNCVGKVTGWSGAEYGQSTYNDALAAHVCRMALSRWRECKGDVTAGAVRRACQWEVDVELPDSPTGEPESAKHTAESLAGVTNYRVLLKVANEAGVENPEQYDNTPALREAILTTQAQRA